METILESNRRKIGDFEVVEFVDEEQIESLRKKLDVDVPLELHWTWEYGSEVEELRALYERGKRGQWNAEEDLDWSTPLPRDEWFMPQNGASLLVEPAHRDGRRRGDLPRGRVGRVLAPDLAAAARRAGGAPALRSARQLLPDHGRRSGTPARR